MSEKKQLSGRARRTHQAPGTVIFTGRKKVDQVLIHYLQYDQKQLVEKTLDNHEDMVLPDSPSELVDWYDVRGIHDTDLIEYFGKAYQVHPLVLEDIADIHQRPKFEDYDDGVFVILRALNMVDGAKVTTEQISIYFKKGLLISFQETSSDLFESVRARISAGKGRVRNRGADYLAYALLDATVDHYFIVLENFELEIENIEEQLLSNPGPNLRARLHQLKRELMVIRKSIAPLREAIGRMTRCENPLIADNTQYFVRDLYDHTIQLLEMTETYRDVINGVQELYISEISFRMNQVMQLLTIITVLFVPVTFIAGIYGMNFDHIPELHYRYGYFMVWGVIVLIFAMLIYYFRRKKWI